MGLGGFGWVSVGLRWFEWVEVSLVNEFEWVWIMGLGGFGWV